MSAQHTNATESYDLAVVGMAGRFPSAESIEQFWRNLCAGTPAIRILTDQELLARGVDSAAIGAPNFVKAAAMLDRPEWFAASFFGFSPREAELMDPQHRVFLECAWQALEHAGYHPDGFDGLIGVYAGASLSSYLLFNLMSHPELRAVQDTFPLMVGNDKDFLSTRVSYHLNLRGPSITVQTGCSTSLVAVHLACEGLLSCQCDMALAGGVSVMVPQRAGYYYQEGGITSPDGCCRAFDAAAQGTVFGSGAGVVVLKRMADAIRDGDTIYALIKGSAVNNDGAAKVGYTAPSMEGQAEVIARAQQIAGVAPDSIGYVETHGTATALGDPVEIGALSSVFQSSTPRRQFCAIGSVKTNIGHLDAAAGIAGLIKTVLALHHGQIPPSLHFETPNPHIDFTASPFVVNTRLRDWPQGATPRRAGVSSFGIGGTNAHVILEEAPALAGSDTAQPYEVLPLSARTATALDSMVARLAAHLRDSPELPLADLAYTLQVGRKPFGQRCMLVCRDAAEALRVLEGGAPERLLRGQAHSERRPVAWLFPGQGTQYVGMARDLYSDEPVFRATVDRCCSLLLPHLGIDLRTILYPREELAAAAAQRLSQTALAQPALFVVCYGLAQLWLSWGIRPDALIGHSVGELVAACVAGVFSLEDALALIAMRGRLMQRIAGGAMLAVALPEDGAQALIAGQPLSVAAVNGPAQCVLSGPAEAIAAIERLLAARAVETHRLPGGHAFHSAMMDAIVEPFRQQVSRVRLQPPAIPLIANLTGDWMTAEQATDPAYWGRQLRETVRFGDGMRHLLGDLAWMLLEVGPGHTLGGLARRNPAWSAEQRVLASLRGPQEQHDDRAFIRSTLGRLWLAGIMVDWPALHAERRRVPLPTYPFERERYWIEPRPFGVQAQPGDVERAALDDWFYTPVWQRLPPLPPGSPGGESPGPRWLIFDDGSALAARLADGLARRGQPCVRVLAGAAFAAPEPDLYTIDPASPRDYAALIAGLAGSGGLPERALHLWSTGPRDDTCTPAERFAATQTVGFYSLLYLAQALDAAGRAQAMRLWVITAQAHDVSGDGRLAPERATVLGLCSVLPQEFGGLECYAIDLPEHRSEQLAAALLAELDQCAPLPLVALRNGQRWGRHFAPVRLDEHVKEAAPLREGGVYVILGGLGRIGLELAEWLASAFRARMVLVSRRGPAPRADWDAWCAGHPDDPDTQIIRRLQAIERAGAGLLICQADVTDPAQLRAVFDQARAEWGTLHGVVHAAGHAGNQAFQLIPQLDRAACERNFHAKVHGAYALADALAGQALDFCLLFSSNAAVLGGLGLGAYAAAHLCMDAFAQQQRHRQPTPWLSINWDHWLRSHEGTRPDPSALHVAEGTEALRRALAYAAAGQIIVSARPLDARVERWIIQRGAPAGDEQAPAILHPRPSLDTVYAPPQDALEQAVIDIWQGMLGVEQIGIHDTFFDLGGTSVIGIKLVAQLNAQLGTDLPVVRLFERPTVSGLVALIREEHDQRPTFDQRQSRGERRRERRAGKEQRHDG